MLIDTHCHLYLPTFENDLNLLVNRCIENGVYKVFLPAIDSETHQRLLALSDKKFDVPPGSFEILPMMGVHPCSIKENFEEELAIAFEKLNNGRKYYAVGEIGLDYYWDVSFKGQQVLAFERQIEWALERGLPISIHSRQSTADCIKSVKKYDKKVRGIFHCFGGTPEEALEIIELGMYLGIGGVVTYKNTNLREILQQTGLGNVVFETDAPYLSPLPYRGKRNEPSYIKVICDSVAQSLQLKPEEVAAISTANALKVFN